jgi:hypothetical protein
MISPDSMRHEAYMKKKFEELGADEEKLLDTFYADRSDMVNSPPHYNQAGIECIYYLQGNIIKYLWRYRYKNGVEDLKKAQWYLGKLIEETSNE